MTSCGLFLGENQRQVVYKSESGTAIQLIISENRLPFSEKRSLVVRSVSDYPLKGRDCEDFELKNFSNEVWSEVVRNNDLSRIASATIVLEKGSVQSRPEYCDFAYSREDGGEWKVTYSGK